MIIDYSSTYRRIEETPLSPLRHVFSQKVEQAFFSNRWGDLPDWLDVLDNLPFVKPSIINFDSDRIIIGKETDGDEAVRENIKVLLKKLSPWRKGPFEIFGIHIDSEWRSDIKWNRLKDHIAPLRGRCILDVGCGNGYYCFRMAEERPKMVIGIDPTMLYVIQFQAMQKYIQCPFIDVFPIGVDDIPQDINMFDTVFSMGLLYHRRSPLDHLLELRSFLKEDGELVLETLVIDGKEGQVLSPQGRYAKMKNVWFIPTLLTLQNWLKRTGFENIRLIDVSTTTSEEQRVTEWMRDESLAQFLDPYNSSLTVEGYPAPQRAVFLANSFRK